jgi:hypothetical protein
MLFVIHSFSVAEEGVRAYRFHSAEGSFSLSKDPSFPVKIQAGYRVESGMHLLFRDTFGITGSLGYEALFPSTLDFGFSYKGFNALNAGLYLSARTPVLTAAPGKGQLYFGSSAGLTGSFARYSGLPHYFFYLGIGVEPTIDITPASGKQWFLRTGFPLVFRLRKDIDLSMSVGLSLHLFHQPVFHLSPKNKEQLL